MATESISARRAATGRRGGPRDRCGARRPNGGATDASRSDEHAGGQRRAPPPGDGEHACDRSAMHGDQSGGPSADRPSGTSLDAFGDHAVGARGARRRRGARAGPPATTDGTVHDRVAGRRSARSAATPRSGRRRPRRTPARSSDHTATSPTAPGASTPSSPVRPRHAAPPSVAISSAMRAVPAPAPSRSLASSIAWRASSHSDAASADDEPSTPRPTCTPAARRATTGAMPEARIRLLDGQWATPTPAAPRRRTSSVSGITQWASQARSVSQPVRSRYSVGRHPNVASENSSSSAFSAKWVCRRTSRRSASSAERTISVLGDAERRARRQRDARHRPVGAVVVAVHGVLAGGEDLVVVGHDVVGRQPAVLLRQRHRAARRVEAHAEVAGGVDLGSRAGRRRRGGGGRGGRSTSCTRTAPARPARPTPTGRPPRCRGRATAGTATATSRTAACPSSAGTPASGSGTGGGGC